MNYPRALPFYPAYAYLGHTPDDFPVAYANQSRILSIPIYPEMTDQAIEYVAGQIESFFQKSENLLGGRSAMSASPVLRSFESPAVASHLISPASPSLRYGFTCPLSSASVRHPSSVI